MGVWLSTPPGDPGGTGYPSTGSAGAYLSDVTCHLNLSVRDRCGSWYVSLLFRYPSVCTLTPRLRPWCVLYQYATATTAPGPTVQTGP